MPRKPEPKFTVIYSDEPIMPESLRKEKYEKFIKFLVKVVKEQEELEKNKVKK